MNEQVIAAHTQNSLTALQFCDETPDLGLFQIESLCNFRDRRRSKPGCFVSMSDGGYLSAFDVRRQTNHVVTRDHLVVDPHFVSGLQRFHCKIENWSNKGCL